MREEFEEWVINAKGYSKSNLNICTVSEKYSSPYINRMWEAWQASRENLNILHNKKFIATKDFNKYLESNGWYAKSTIPGIATIWRSNVFKNEEILQPINCNLLDFEQRVNDLIQVLSRIQQKSKEEIIIHIFQA